MNFKITISDGHQKKSFQFQSGSVTIEQMGTDDVMRILCLVRPDDWLQARSNAVSKSGLELTYATIIESDPVRDPNHWLKKDSSQIGKKMADSQAVRNRRHRVRRKHA